MRHYNQKEKRTAPLSARVPGRMQWLYVMQSCRCSLRAVCALRGRISDSISIWGLVCECCVIYRVVEGNGARSGERDGIAHPHAFSDWELRMSVV